MTKPKQEKSGTGSRKTKPRTAKSKSAGTGTRRPSTKGRSSKASKSPKSAKSPKAAKAHKSSKRARSTRSAKNPAATNGRRKPAAAVDAAAEPGLGPGPRMAQILQAEIAPWKRDNLSDEEAQLREINRMPVRNVYDSEEARRRLVGRTTSPAKRRLRSRSTSTSNA